MMSVVLFIDQYALMTNAVHKSSTNKFEESIYCRMIKAYFNKKIVMTKGRFPFR